MIITEMNQRIKNCCKLCSERNHYDSGLWNLKAIVRSKALGVAAVCFAISLLILCIVWTPINPRTNMSNDQNIKIHESDEQMAFLSKQLSVQNNTIQRLTALIQTEQDLRNENELNIWHIKELGQKRKDLQKAIISLNPRTNTTNNQQIIMHESDEQIACLREQLNVQNCTIQRLKGLIFLILFYRFIC